MAGLKPWVEQVDFRLPASRCMSLPSPCEVMSEKQTIPSISVSTSASEIPYRPGHSRRASLPSLEQITERYSERNSQPSSPPPPRIRAPLPAFLHARCQTSADTASCEISNERESGCEMETRVTETSPSRPRPLRLASTGRIQFPVRSSPSPPAQAPAAEPSPPSPSPKSLPTIKHARRRVVALSSVRAPVSPKMPLPPKTPTTQVTPMHVQRAEASLSSFSFGSGPKLERASLTEANLAALDSRAKTARDMLSAVRRRTTVVGLAKGGEKLRFAPPVSPRPLVHTSLEDGAAEMLRKLGAYTYASDYEKMQRRNSAPAELSAAKKRTGGAFSHPVLAHPGGF